MVLPLSIFIAVNAVFRPQVRRKAAACGVGFSILGAVSEVRDQQFCG